MVRAKRGAAACAVAGVLAWHGSACPAAQAQSGPRLPATLAPGSLAPATLPRPPAPLPRLTGVVATGRTRQAIFTAPDGLGALVAGEGDRLGPYTVTAITAGAAELTGPGGAYLLHPTPHAGLRPGAGAPPAPALSYPARREAETENDQ